MIGGERDHCGAQLLFGKTFWRVGAEEMTGGNDRRDASDPPVRSSRIAAR